MTCGVFWFRSQTTKIHHINNPCNDHRIKCILKEAAGKKISLKAIQTPKRKAATL